MEAMAHREGEYSHALLVTGSRTWDDEAGMRRAFNRAWMAWGAGPRDPGAVSKPVLVSGHCSRGADAMAERLWRAAGFEVLEFPARWDIHGKAAGYRRNEEMVSTLVAFQQAGVMTRCVAFLHRAPSRDARAAWVLAVSKPMTWRKQAAHRGISPMAPCTAGTPQWRRGSWWRMSRTRRCRRFEVGLRGRRHGHQPRHPPACRRKSAGAGTGAQTPRVRRSSRHEHE